MVYRINAMLSPAPGRRSAGGACAGGGNPRCGTVHGRLSGTGKIALHHRKSPADSPIHDGPSGQSPGASYVVQPGCRTGMPLRGGSRSGRRSETAACAVWPSTPRKAQTVPSCRRSSSAPQGFLLEGGEPFQDGESSPLGGRPVGYAGGKPAYPGGGGPWLDGQPYPGMKAVPPPHGVSPSPPRVGGSQWSWASEPPEASCGSTTSSRTSPAPETPAQTVVCVSSGLGAIQPEGRQRVLDEWSSPGAPGQEQASRRPTTHRPAVEIVPARTRGVQAPKLEWSTLSPKCRKAIQSWISGNIGGRHCLMLLEHDAAIAFFISPLDDDEVIMSDLRGGAVLNALSGLPAEAKGGWEGGWLHREVFGKTPQEVLDEALEAALEDADDPNFGEPPANLSHDQVNLALRRKAMHAQAMGMRTLAVDAASGGRRPACEGPRCSEEYMRVQVWLEVARLHAEGAMAEGPMVARSARPGSKEKPMMPAQPTWDDESVTLQLGKPEADLEAEAHRMSLEALRQQNRSIEAYLMRLVRQRDKLRRIATLAEECDSYLVLGLNGPDATEDEVKKAYRELARKEHPDKAGTDNKERFQQIQQAYAAVQRKRKILGAEAGAAGAASSASQAAAPPCAVTREAALRAEMAREAADEITTIAHYSFHLRAKAREARGQQKRACLRELQAYMRKSLSLLWDSAERLRALCEAASAVAKCAEAKLKDYGDWADTAMAGAGLRERAGMVEKEGQSCLASASHLEKLGEHDELLLKKMERTSELDVGAAARVLSEGIARTATVGRCAADEALATATQVLELSCSLAVLERQRRAEQREEAAKQQHSDSPRVGEPPSGERAAGPSPGGGGGDSPKKADEEKEKEKDKEKEKEKKDPALDEPTTPDGLRGQQAMLRVRHLQCLGSLNEEVLTLQSKLRSLVEQREGSLLPTVAGEQKGGVFDLVAQLLHYAIGEASRILSSEPTLPPRQVLDKAFSFALALEHAREVAMPSEVKTQALKLAALLDVDLLCQIIEGPFKRRLVQLGARQRAGANPYARRSGPLRGQQSAPSAPEAWVDAVDALCGRVARGLREPLLPAAAASQK